MTRTPGSCSRATPWVCGFRISASSGRPRRRRTSTSIRRSPRWSGSPSAAPPASPWHTSGWCPTPSRSWTRPRARCAAGPRSPRGRGARTATSPRRSPPSSAPSSRAPIRPSARSSRPSTGSIPTPPASAAGSRSVPRAAGPAARRQAASPITTQGAHMPEAVIVSTARSPIRRAMEGSLVGCRPDDLAATLMKAALEDVPQLDPQSVDDVIMGCGQPGGESGFNVARAAGILAGMPDVPGVTVNRYCSSSLQTIRMAAHAIKAGEGDAFISAGVETVSRYGNGMADSGPTNPVFADAQARTAERANGADSWQPAEGVPDIYIAMGQTAENVRLAENVSRREMDELAALSQQRAVANQENGYWDGEITPVTTPSGN